jgi:hypothetical protein
MRAAFFGFRCKQAQDLDWQNITSSSRRIEMGLTSLMQYIELETVFMANLPEVNQMSKSQDAKKTEKKEPQKTPKEKKQAKRDKKNK